MSDISVGQVVELLENGRFILGACLEKKSGRYHLLTNLGKETNLTSSRFIHISPVKLSTQSKNTLIKDLQQINLTRDSLTKEIDLKELWEVLKDEKEVFQPKEIAELLYAEKYSPDHEAALIRAVMDEQFYFKFRDNIIFVQSSEIIAKLFEKREQEQREMRKFEKGLFWIKKLFNEKISADVDLNDPELKEFIEDLKDYSINGEESSQKTRQIKNFLKNTQLPHGITPLNILIKSGVWHEDINIEMLKLGVSNDFSQSTYYETDNITKGFIIYENIRKDLTSLETITVDGPDTLDHDDAISFLRNDNHWELGIHIADFSHKIDHNGEIFKSATNRATSIYMPDMIVTMIPEILCHKEWSLIAGKNRETISFVAKINDNGDIIKTEIFQSVINVKKRLNYSDLDERIKDNKNISLLYEFCLKFQDERVKKGALPLPIPELNIKIKSGIPEISLSPITPARFLIAECMVLANNIGASFLKDNGLPAIYRSQPEPRERIIKGFTDDVKLNFQQRRLISRGIMDTEPSYHSGLGLNAYTTLTSPLRRALDLIMQKQFSNYFHTGKPLFSKDDLAKYLLLLQDGLLTASQLTQARNRFWILKFFSRMINIPMKAWFLENIQNKVLAVLDDYLITVELPRQTDMKLMFGDPLNVIIKRSVPRENILKADWARE